MWFDFFRILIAVGLVAALGLALYLIMAVLNTLRQQRPNDHPDLEFLRAEVEALRERVALLESQLREEKSAVITDDATRDPLYTSAVSLLKDGLGSDEVAGRLGLSEAEVDLISSFVQK